MTNVLETLTKSDNPVIAILAFLVVVLAGVVVYQWNHTARKTVPKWIWDAYGKKTDDILGLQKEIMLILDERLKK